MWPPTHSLFYFLSPFNSSFEFLDWHFSHFHQPACAWVAVVIEVGGGQPNKTSTDDAVQMFSMSEINLLIFFIISHGAVACHCRTFFSPVIVNTYTYTFMRNVCTSLWFTTNKLSASEIPSLLVLISWLCSISKFLFTFLDPCEILVWMHDLIWSQVRAIASSFHLRSSASLTTSSEKVLLSVSWSRSKNFESKEVEHTVWWYQHPVIVLIIDICLFLTENWSFMKIRKAENTMQTNFDVRASRWHTSIEWW